MQPSTAWLTRVLFKSIMFLSLFVVLQGKWRLSIRKEIIAPLIYCRRARTGALHVNTRWVSFAVCVWFLNSFQVEKYRPKNYRFAEHVECVTTPVWFNLAFCPGVRT